MLPVLFFIFYFIVMLIALIALARKKNIDIDPLQMFFIYAFKVVMGCLYGYIFLSYYRGDDTWAYHRESLLQYEKMIHHPLDFLKDFLPYSAFDASKNFFQGMQFYIEDLEFYSTTKMLAVFNIFSQGNYYINVLLFDFVSLIGLFLLYKLLTKFFAGKHNLLILFLFFLPLPVFWLSGIRAEGLLLLFIAISIYYSYKWFTEKQKTRYLIFVIAGLIGCIILRAQMLLIFMPTFLSVTLSWKKPNKAIYYFSFVYLTCAFIFLGSIFISHENNLSIPVIKRQQEFLHLHGNTEFRLDSLQPTVSSFIKILPQAFGNTFLRPFLWEAKGFLQIITAIDIIFFWLLAIAILFYHKTNWHEIIKKPLILLFIFYGVTQIIFIGYVVPFPGAIVRYKCIPELFLFIVMGLLLDENIISKRLK